MTDKATEKVIEKAEKATEKATEKVIDKAIEKPRRTKRYVASRDEPGHIFLDIRVDITKEEEKKFSNAGFTSEKGIRSALAGYYGDPAAVPKEDRPKGWVPFPVDRLKKAAMAQLETIANERRIDEIEKATAEYVKELATLKELRAKIDTTG